MSKYTTEVRYICESAAGYKEPQGLTNVDLVLSKSWDKVITTKAELFDELYRETLYTKILKHYYTREIAAETVGLWQLWINTRLEEILPYYNKMYESALIEYDPLSDVNYIRRSSGKTTDQTSSHGKGTNKAESWNLYSDTPQGGLSGVDSNTYLTNAQKNTDGTESTSESGSQGTSENDYTETMRGKTAGGKSLSALLEEYRHTFVNVDKMIIEDLKDLFFNLW